MLSPEEQVRREAQLAHDLARASAAERQGLYAAIYDEIYAMHLARDPDVLDFGASPRFIPFLARHSATGASVLEVGCGTGLLALALARMGRRVVGVDVSGVALERARARASQIDGLEFMRVDGVRLPFPDRSFDLVYSLEVLEHLHADDVPVHLAETRRVLAPRGTYVFWTPHAGETLDAAERFHVAPATEDAAGDVHLKEWTYGELGPLLRSAGFDRVGSPWHMRFAHLPLVPISVYAVAERLARDRGPTMRKVLGIDQCAVVARVPSDGKAAGGPRSRLA